MSFKGASSTTAANRNENHSPPKDANADNSNLVRYRSYTDGNRVPSRVGSRTCVSLYAESTLGNSLGYLYHNPRQQQQMMNISGQLKFDSNTMPRNHVAKKAFHASIAASIR